MCVGGLSSSFDVCLGDTSQYQRRRRRELFSAWGFIFGFLVGRGGGGGDLDRSATQCYVGDSSRLMCAKTRPNFDGATAASQELRHSLLQRPLDVLAKRPSPGGLP